ncbi:MAG TPA: hypothetical protein VLA58_04800, partial [Chitinophagaceae bacterium]|nr:hypothetical protein [Chitinophagaceae bacterium]
DLHNFDFIYAMANDVIRDMKYIAGKAYDPSKVDLLMNTLHPGKDLDVPDPWYGGEDGYHKVYDLISSACERIIMMNAPSNYLTI